MNQLTNVIKSTNQLTNVIKSINQPKYGCYVIERLTVCFLGLVSWDVSEIPVDISRELTVLTDCAPPGEEARGGKFILLCNIWKICTEFVSFE